MAKARMKIMKRFDAEQWMTEYEHRCQYNLADTSLQALSLKELAGELEDLLLDYGAIDGTQDVKEAILSLYESGSPFHILPSIGCSQANFLVLKALLKPGDRMICFRPDYEQYEQIAADLGVDVNWIDLDDDGSIRNKGQAEKLLENDFKVIMGSFPNNPAGFVMPAHDLDWLIKQARKKDAWVVFDEVYRLDTPSISDLYEKGVSTSSLSKVYRAPGLRFGWIKADPELIEQIRLLKDYYFISTGLLSDRLALLLLQNKEELKKKAEIQLKENKHALQKWLKEHPDFSAEMGCGNSVMLRIPETDDVSWAERMANDHSVLFVPGSFYHSPGTVRLGLGIAADTFKENLKAFTKALEKEKEEPADS